MSRQWPFRTILLAMVLCQVAAAAAAAPQALEPLDTSSPRATLSQFLESVDNIGRAAMIYRDGPSRQNFLRTARSFAPSRNCFDLSQIPETARREHSGEALVLLWEVLSRIELPPLEQVPDRAAMKERVAGGEPDRWTLPHTDITLARVKEGGRAGEYLFSPSTVERLPEFYRKVEKLPYVRAMTINNPRHLHKLWGGWMIPPKVAESMPAWLKFEMGDQVMWKWLLVILLLALMLYLTWKVHRWAGLVTQGPSLGQYSRRCRSPTSPGGIAYCLRRCSACAMKLLPISYATCSPGCVSCSWPTHKSSRIRCACGWSVSAILR